VKIPSLEMFQGEGQLVPEHRMFSDVQLAREAPKEGPFNMSWLSGLKYIPSNKDSDAPGQNFILSRLSQLHGWTKRELEVHLQSVEKGLIKKITD